MLVTVLFEKLIRFAWLEEFDASMYYADLICLSLAEQNVTKTMQNLNAADAISYVILHDIQNDIFLVYLLHSERV